MVDRGNWKLIRAYLKYRKEVDLLSASSVTLEEGWLRHLLEWAGEKSFKYAHNIRPSFPEYMLSARLDNKTGQLSPVYVKKVVRASQRFFEWVKKHHVGFGSINQAWIDTLKPPRMTVEKKDHEAVTIDEIRAIAKAPTFSLRDRRVKVAAVFLFLSGIRVGAFVSLPIEAVDLENLEVKQWPKLGVKTKFKKHATTYLLDIPDLLEVVRDWDREIRMILTPGCMWFAPFSPDTEEIDPKITEIGIRRHDRLRKDLRDWLGRVNLQYHSPHKFRHGHAVYALKRAKDVPALKAVSQNLMHSNLSITDGVYGVLSDNDVKGQIAALGKRMSNGGIQDIDEIITALENLKNKGS